MVRATLVVGAGKANRQKYDASLQKWVVAALKDAGYADDKSATCDFAAAGSFKTQHDTGRNLFFVHVFPRCSQKTAAAVDDDAATATDPAALSREHLLVAAELPTFSRTVSKKCASWTSKKRLLDALRGVRAQFAAADEKLMRREALDDDEQALYPRPGGTRGRTIESRGRDADVPRRRVAVAAAPTWLFRGDKSRRGRGCRRGYSAETSLAVAAAATWIFRGDEPRGRRGRDLDSPRRRVAAVAAAATWIVRGDESRRRRGRDLDVPWIAP